MFGPKLWRDPDGLARSQRIIQHGLVQTLGVQVQLDPAAATGDTGKNSLPEVIAAFVDPTFTVGANRHARNGGTLLQQQTQGVATIWTMVGRRQPADGVIG